ncbi:MAG: hypothetical protein RML12_05805 [Xanthomonadales bacterium]|nr:hypothetical protein [Xanthomonadales bacterium]
MRRIACFATLALAFAASAEELKLLPAAPGDLVPERLEAAKIAAVERHGERALLQFAWPLDPQTELDFRPEPFLAESREFWTLVEPAELAAGFRFVTTAPGALIRLSPAGQAKGGRLDLAGLAIEVDGRRLAAEHALASLAADAELKRAGAEFPEGTVAFRLRPELGAGPSALILPKATGPVLVHVFEPDSPVVLRLRAGDLVPQGGRLALAGELRAEPFAKAASRLAGLITAPDGRSQGFELEARGPSFQGEIALDPALGPGEGLWELHLFAAAGELRRDVRTAFAVSRPSARLAGTARRDGRREAEELALEVEVALAGRYELRATITGTAADGRELPLAEAHAAAWLEPGRGTIPLRIERSHLVRPGVGAPWALRDLRLIRQGDQNLQERRDRALSWR